MFVSTSTTLCRYRVGRPLCTGSVSEVVTHAGSRGHGRGRGFHAGASKCPRGEQPLNGVPEIGLRAASCLNQCDAGGCMRNKDMTQAVAAVVAELTDH